MAGNVTPKNVKFVANVLSAYVDAGIYPEVRRQLFALAADPVFSQNGGSVGFRPTGVIYDDPSGKVFVRGELITNTVAGKPNAKEYIFEWKLDIRQRRPWVTDVQHYTGAERTAKWLKHRQATLDRKESRPRLSWQGPTHGSTQKHVLARRQTALNRCPHNRRAINNESACLHCRITHAVACIVACHRIGIGRNVPPGGHSTAAQGGCFACRPSEAPGHGYARTR